MDQRKKILRDFSGEMSESVKVTRWGVPVSGQDDSNHNLFMQYAGGPGQQMNSMRQTSNQIYETTQVLEETRKQTNTFNQIAGVQSGFRKLKNNQAMTLKQLKQEYQILKNLPIDDRIPLSPKGPASDNSSNQEDQSVSSKNSKSQKRDSSSRQVQLLSLEKKQLEVVIGNSMRKIQQLLHNEMTYKKQIHQLKLQLDDRSPEQKYQNLIRTLKKNQADAHDSVESLKREIQRLKGVGKQQNEAINRLQSQIMAKNQELIKNSEERRKFDDMIRFEKDKFVNLEIEAKRVRMESQVNEKDKTNEVNRLLKQLQAKDSMYEREWSTKVKRLEEQLSTREHRYNLLLDQFQQMKKTNGPADRNEKREEPRREQSDPYDNIKKFVMEAISGQSQSNQLKELLSKMDDLRQENRELRNELRNIQEQGISEDPKKSQMFMDTINTLFQRMDTTNKTTDDTLKREVQFLRNQVDSLHKRPDTVQKVREQDLIIKQLQKIVDEENFQKRKFLGEIEHIREEYENVRMTNDKNKHRLADLIEKQKAYKQEIYELRRDNEILRQDIEILRSTKGNMVNSQSELVELRLKGHHFEVMESQNKRLHQESHNLRATLKRKEDDHEGQVRHLKRKLDETQFQVDKLQKQLSFNLELEKSSHMTEISRLRADLEIIEKDKTHLMRELDRVKQIYETKLNEKDREVNGLKTQYEERIDHTRAEKDHIKEKFEEIHKSRIFEFEGVKKTYEDQIKMKGEDQQQLRSYYEQILHNQRTKFEGDLQGLRDRHYGDLQAMRERHQQQIHTIRQQWQNDVKVHRERFESDTQVIREKHQVFIKGFNDKNEGLIRSIRDKHEQQLSVILKRLEMLTDANEKFMLQNERFLEMETQLVELRRVLRSTKSMNDGVDHLWQIKETQYTNVNEILRHMRVPG